MDPARILIVDDEPFNLDLLEQELEILGHASVRAADGRAALELLGEGAYDLVLLDVMMPMLDGYAVLRAMKAHERLRHTPVVMISALTEISSIARCIEMGAEDYLPKPFEPVLLEARVRACLERKRLHDRELAHLETIEHARRRADDLLRAILPAAAVGELMATGTVKPRLFHDVAVLFIDLVGFTTWCHAQGPEAVVAEVQRLAEAFEAVADRHGLEKIKTIGDAFMATANLLAPHADPVTAAVDCVRDMVPLARDGSTPWRIRAGIHVGPVVGGVVGQTKFTFDLWGDTVNVAARLCALGDGCAVHLSGEAAARVRDGSAIHPIGKVFLKGKGEHEVHCCAFAQGHVPAPPAP
ncbi:response regulator [Methylobacterium sp. E-016]|uniref:adenylate/guanylate cyclase domain-containing protein n=1 Tax=Methylobacterium sp. E-016 TaxID=2836556 RepID=UPI001FBB6A7F|nr:adenylate/guanylate cyclase domain-containing protein [Methylobacterium sp. E-016]MCJ2077104.1 response regulator [Methylobacterium sp. E-016]